MFTRNAIIRMTLSGFALLILYLVCPSVIAQTPGDPQQAQIYNSRSNLKNTSRVEPSIDRLKVELVYPQNARTIAQQSGGDSGPEWLSRVVSTNNGEFDLGMLPAGEYELRFSDADGHSNATANRGITISSSHVEYDKDRKAAANADPKHNSEVGRLTMTLTGVVGGPLKHELKADLDSKIDSEVARAGKPKFKNVVAFKADGRSGVKGTLRHDMVKSSIQNMK